MPYSSLTSHDKEAMLKTIGIASPDELFSDIPAELRDNAAPGLGEALSELETRRKMSTLAAKNLNMDQAACFLGAGSYDHFIPAVVPALAFRGEFATAYTPYQAESSQGTLQVIYEFQTLLCQLTQMEMANASLYDGATALAEAVIMAQAATKRKKILIPRAVSPFYRRVVQSYTQGLDTVLEEVPFSDGVTSLEAVQNALCPDVAGVVLQHPNFFGCLEDAQAISNAAHEAGALLISVFNPVSLGLLPPPGAYGADIAVAEGQSLGIAPQFGGPGVGLFACKQKFARLAPGRLVGMTVDNQGRDGFTLTLQTREQHIRREKATSNICTNQALCALLATIYLSAMGPKGLKTAAEQSYHKAHFAADKVGNPAFGSPFFHEWAVKLNRPVGEANAQLREQNIIGGYDLSRDYPELPNTMLLCCTEKRTREEIERLAEALEFSAVSHSTQKVIQDNPDRAAKRQMLVALLKNLSPNMREKLEELKLENKQLERPDFIWHFLLQSFATQGNSRGWHGLIGNSANYNRVTFEALSKFTPTERLKEIEEVLQIARVRMSKKKATQIDHNFDLIQRMGGLEEAKRQALAQPGMEAKIAFVKRFQGIGDKYARNFWMDVCHPDFHDAIAVDVRIQNISKALGYSFASYAEHERFYQEIARESGLQGWELDRLLYNFEGEILRRLG